MRNASRGKHTANRPVLRASEIGEYVFCHRAWWLDRVRGIPSTHRAQMDAGTARHLAHGQGIQRAIMLRRAALVLLALAVLFALALVILLVGNFPS